VNAIKKFRITEDMKGIIALSAKTQDGYFRLRGGYEEHYMLAYKSQSMSFYNALLQDVRIILAGGDIEKVRRNQCQLMSASSFGFAGPQEEVILLADEEGVYPDAMFSNAARCVLLNAEHVCDDEWCSLGSFYSWDNWFAKLKRVSFMVSDKAESKASDFRARLHFRPLPSLSVAPVVFAGELWNGR
jgi:hypothetical protein